MSASLCSNVVNIVISLFSHQYQIAIFYHIYYETKLELTDFFLINTYQFYFQVLHLFTYLMVMLKSY